MILALVAVVRNTKTATVLTTRKDTLNNLTASLTPNYGQREALCIAKLALEKTFMWSQTDYIIDGQTPIDIDEEKLDNLTQELLSNKPVQYVLGLADFADMEFEVGDGVLIPRQETELLVNWIKQENKVANILDIGTGSGAIAIALAKDTDFTLTAIDISEDALKIAKKNIVKHGLNIDLRQVDILHPSDKFKEQQFDVIVSNPPYIPEQEKLQMHDNVVNFEPHTALFVPDNDPLLFYREIAKLAIEMLRDGGKLYFEIHENFASETIKLLKDLGYTNIELRCDLNQKARMIRCQKNL